MLTPRQFEIARLVAQGKSYKAIARETQTSPLTVRNHVKAAALKIDASSSRPRDTVQIWFLGIRSDDAAA
jgi:DNA-binding CsgD family transcriptional regulator